VTQVKIDTALKLTPTLPERATAKSARTGAAGEQVQLSDAAHIREGEPPPIDSSRVQEIKQAIAEGRFRINPEAIAERLISTAQELIDAQRKA
jgi:negative regulator of flagellin synthesis FlgM